MFAMNNAFFGVPKKEMEIALILSLFFLCSPVFILFHYGGVEVYFGGYQYYL